MKNRFRKICLNQFFHNHSAPCQRRGEHAPKFGVILILCLLRQEEEINLRKRSEICLTTKGSKGLKQQGGEGLFHSDLNTDNTENMMAKIRKEVNTSFNLRHVYGYRLRNIENGEQIVYYTNIGSPILQKQKNGCSRKKNA